MATAFAPTLSSNAEAGSVTIESGAVLNGGTGALTIKRGPFINGGAGSWNNLGTFNPGTSTVVFNYSGGTYSGTTDFYNLTILHDTSKLTMQSGSVMRIAGTMVNNGNWEADVFENTVEYNGTAQTILKPDGTQNAYYNLVLGGSGIKTMPASSLLILGDYTLSGTASVSATGALTIGDEFSIGENAAFTADDFSHSIGGNVTNNGFLDAGNGTITMTGASPQIFSGSSATTFYNLTIDNASGVTLNSSGLTTVTGTIRINSGKKLDLAAGKHLTVSGSFINSEGPVGFTIRSSETGTGSLLYDGAVDGTMERYIPNDFKWHFLSSPVTSQNIWPAFAPEPEELSGLYYFTQTPYNWDFYYWNPNASTTNQLYWVNLRKNEEGEYNERDVEATGSEAGFGASIPPTFIPGRGYLVAYSDDWNPVTGSPTVRSFSGTISGGSVSWNITNGANPYNLVGNPYPSSIDWKSAAGWSQRSNLALSGGGYDYWIYSDDAGNYGLFNSAGSSGTLGTSRYIAPMQSVFLQATATGSIGMDHDVQSHSLQSWLKQAPLDMNILRFRLSTIANTWYDEFNLEVDPVLQYGGSRKFRSMHGEAPEIWSIRDDRSYSIERRSRIDDNAEIILGVKAGVSSNYLLKISGTEFFSCASQIILEDLISGHTQELKSHPEYHFSAAPGDPSARLKIRFNGPYGIEKPAVLSTAMIWYSDHIIFVRGLNHENLTGKVTVFSLSGQTLLGRNVQGSDIRIPINLPIGCFIVSFISQNGVVNRKIMAQ